MTKSAPKNLAASVRQKLANLARERNVDFGLMLVKYGLERILFRLSRSRRFAKPSWAARSADP